MAKHAEQDKRVKFLARLPPELHRWLKVAAAERGTNMNDILVAALDSARMRLGSDAPRKNN
jgi:predicted HicB family RNase H-like nuclease